MVKGKIMTHFYKGIINTRTLFEPRTRFILDPEKQIGKVKTNTKIKVFSRDGTATAVLQAARIRDINTFQPIFISIASLMAHNRGEEQDLVKVKLDSLEAPMEFAFRRTEMPFIVALKALGLPSAEDLVKKLSPLQINLIFAVYSAQRTANANLEEREFAFETMRNFITSEAAQDTSPLTDGLSKNSLESILKTFFSLMFKNEVVFNSFLKELLSPLENAQEFYAVIESIQELAGGIRQ